MNIFLLYLLLLKSTMTSFSGLSSLPIIHADLVEHHRVLSAQQLNTAVAAGRSGPGPAGLYVVSVGYMVAGTPGAVAGYLAMVTPAFLILPILHFFSRYASHPAVRRAIRAILLSAAGLLLSSTIPLGRDALTGILTIGVALVSFALLAFTKVETLWVILGAAVLGAVASLL
jgi:chromate transporter